MNQTATQQSIEEAAQCWCDPRTSNRTMDAELAMVFAERLDASCGRTLCANQCFDVEPGYVAGVPGPNSPEDRAKFATELTQLINRHSIENDSNTPDWVLAEYLMACLDTFEGATACRDGWYGIEAHGTGCSLRPESH